VIATPQELVRAQVATHCESLAGAGNILEGVDFDVSITPYPYCHPGETGWTVDLSFSGGSPAMSFSWLETEEFFEHGFDVAWNIMRLRAWNTAEELSKILEAA
jgi:hypothetical protein